MSEQGTFSWALERMKEGAVVFRAGWSNPSIYVRVQFPDEKSMNTKPYLVMVKKDDTFPLDLSCESIFADDWEELVKESVSQAEQGQEAS